MRDPFSIDRDPALPKKLGDPFSAPSEAEIRELVHTHLAPEPAAAIDTCRWETARWKPGVSLTCTYRVGTAHGGRRIVWKSYADGKSRHLTAADFEQRGTNHETPLAPAVLLPGGAQLLYAYPHDRRLPGLRHVVDTRWTARFLEDSGVAPPRSVRRRRIVDELVRYKPERRAVLKRALDLRPPAVERKLELGLRVLEPEAAHRTWAARRVLAEVDRELAGPTLLAADPSHGVLFERWLPAEALPVDDFSRGIETGLQLARLHATPLPTGVARIRSSSLAGDRELLARDRRASERAERFDLPRERSTGWTHGDFHPDHLAQSCDAWVLLDWDEVGAGDRALDLASWIADAIADGSCDARNRAAELLSGHEAGQGPADVRDDVVGHVPAQLVARAAAAMRRLERGAVARAHHLLDQANLWSRAGTVL